MHLDLAQAKKAACCYHIHHHQLSTPHTSAFICMVVLDLVRAINKVRVRGETRCMPICRNDGLPPQLRADLSKE